VARSELMAGMTHGATDTGAVDVSCLGWLTSPLPALDDEDGLRVDADLPYIVDAHVHVFPERMFAAIYAWFDQHGWPIRHKLDGASVLEFLLGRGVGQVVALHYAHKSGIARSLNTYMASLVGPRVQGVATVFPGEPDAAAILREGFAMGLRGVKLHCHVQCFAVDDPKLHEVYDACVAHDQPIVIHAGREPRSPAYACDPHALCSAARTEEVLRSYPRLRVLVPHLGSDEEEAYAGLIERYDNLWLDTTMVMADYFPRPSVAPTIIERRPDRVMYGTDFPILPYAWDRELVRIKQAGLRDATLERLLATTAREFHRLK
jgi:predicted TIM-barrel fold metal-dependent hydrolase